MKSIVAVDANWGIGYKGELLVRIPDDMKFFKQTTLGKVVVMGRETFESLPGKQPLKDRVNIVLSKSVQLDNDNIKVCRSLEQLFSELQKYPTEDVFVIGGESVYSQLLPYCSEAYVTKIDNVYMSDKFFVNLDEDKAWKVLSSSDTNIYDDITYRFEKYIKIEP